MGGTQFKKPDFKFEFNPQEELERLREHKKNRQIPEPADDKLLVATWNIAALGNHLREDQHLLLIAEMLCWFDVVAIQECRSNFGQLEDLVDRLKEKKNQRYVMSDPGGNDERMVFLYDANKVTLLEEIGEVNFSPRDTKNIKIKGSVQAFNGFDRSPFFVGFQFLARNTSFTLATVHLFYGSEAREDMNRRALEALAVVDWAIDRSESKFSFTRELLVLGDFNLPKTDPKDPIYQALTVDGLELPPHSTQADLGSSLKNDKRYDQIAFLPGHSRHLMTGKGVFDFDQVVFKALWERQDQKDHDKFYAYLRYYLSDHRPMWVQLDFPTP